MCNPRPYFPDDPPGRAYRRYKQTPSGRSSTTTDRLSRTSLLIMMSSFSLTPYRFSHKRDRAPTELFRPTFLFGEDKTTSQERRCGPVITRHFSTASCCKTICGDGNVAAHILGLVFVPPVRHGPCVQPRPGQGKKTPPRKYSLGYYHLLPRFCLRTTTESGRA